MLPSPGAVDPNSRKGAGSNTGKSLLIVTATLAIGMLATVIARVLELVYPQDLEAQIRGFTGTAYVMVPLVYVVSYALVLGAVALVVGLFVRFVARRINKVTAVAYPLFACLFLLSGLFDVCVFFYSHSVRQTVIQKTQLTYRVLWADGNAVPYDDVEAVAVVIDSRLTQNGQELARVMVSEPGRILVEVPTWFASRAKSLISRSGALEFRVVADRYRNAAVLEEVQKTGNDPEGWHSYGLARFDETTGAIRPPEHLLVSDQNELTGEDIVRASVGFGGGTGTEVAVHVRFKDVEKFANVTRKYQPTEDTPGARLAIVLDDVRDKNGDLVRLGRVQSAPTIRQVILGGNAEITGGFSREEAEELKLVLQSGSLKVPLELESERILR